MSRLDVVEQFIALARAAQTHSELFDLLETSVREIGFAYFALVHHADLRDQRSKIIRLYNYPSAWVDYFIANALYAEDPIHIASLHSNVGFRWSDISDKIQLTRRQHRILEMAAEHGLRNGYTVPANIPGEATGSCSFAMADTTDLPEHSLLVAELIGDFAFEAARRLGRNQNPPGNPPPRLTPRQHDCLLLAIHGKTDWEISRILGLSRETVTQHLEMAREKYGVLKRVQLAVRAIYDGQISFLDALEGQFPKTGE
jgi:LuxR family quorum-sensing system transcriptional regulator CciR